MLMYCDILTQAKVMIIMSKLEQKRSPTVLMGSILSDILFLKEIVLYLLTTEVNDMLQRLNKKRQYLFFFLTEKKKKICVFD